MGSTALLPHAKILRIGTYSRKLKIGTAIISWKVSFYLEESWVWWIKKKSGISKSWTACVS